MNRSTGSRHLLAVGESRMADWPSRPASANRCRWRAAEVPAFTADLRRQGRPGNRQRPARQPAPARDMPALHITRKGARGTAPEGSVVTRCASSRAVGCQRDGATPQHAAGRPATPATSAELARPQPGGAGSR
jgi:hypothetical protein